MNASRRVYVIDDSPEELLFIERICQSIGLEVEMYQSGREFLDQFDPEQNGCALLDMLMPEMDGLELFQEIRKRTKTLTCVLMTGFGDTASCRAAFRAGIFDFIEKNAGPREFLDVIERAFEHSSMQSGNSAIGLPANWEKLTDREREVAEQLMHGFTLKKIAALLGITVQTASKHRSKVFEKLCVSSEVELLRQSLEQNASQN